MQLVILAHKKARMVTFRGNFIGFFKLGDNIQSNLESLRLLYRYFDAANPSEQAHLCKNITVTIASVIEAILHDFVLRVRYHTREQSVCLPKELINKLRRTTNKAFGFYIDQLRHYDVFLNPTGKIYSDLDKLRALRNRVHIQNTKGHRPLDESRAFTLSRKINAEQLLEKVLKFMCDKQSRPLHVAPMQDFVLPWQAHEPE